MSAIFGIFRFDGEQVDRADLERMAAALRHRGRDGERHEDLGLVGLGHCLTQVNREDRFEAQPLTDEALDLTLVADCRIDNRETLAATFGWDTASLARRPDSAFILEAYRHWGDRGCERLVGDFTFALWDGRKRILLLARDHGGQRGLLFHRGPGFIAFATEARALLALPGVPTTLCDAELVATMLPRISRRAGRTMFEAIEGVPAATQISVSAAGGFETRRYWRPHADSRHVGHDEAYYARTYRDVLGEAVACRIRRLIKPPALSLSGGFDSGSLAALAGPALDASGHRLTCVSAVAPEGYGGPHGDARPMVEACRRHMPYIDVRYVTPEEADPIASADRIAWALHDVPQPQIHMVDAIFRAAAIAGSRVILQGYGGDMTLHPRDGWAIGWYLRTGQLRRFAREFRIVRAKLGVGTWPLLRSTLQLAFPSLEALAIMIRERFSRFRAWDASPVRTDLAKRLVAEGAVSAPAYLHGDMRVIDMAASQRDWLEYALTRAAPVHGPLAASHGLEVSKPYLDPRVVEFAQAIPRELHFRDGRARHIARVALYDLYPPEFQTRGPRNDVYAPTYEERLAERTEELRQQIAELRDSPRLAAMIDFASLESNLLGPRSSDLDKLIAMRALLTARTIRMFERSNR